MSAWSACPREDMSPSEGTLFSSGEEKGARSVGTVDGPVDGIQLPVVTYIYKYTDMIRYPSIVTNGIPRGYLNNLWLLGLR